MRLVVEMVLEVERAGPLRRRVRDGWIVGQFRVVHREVDRVEAEAVDAPLQPEAGGGEQGLLNLGIVDVEVRLGAQEIVEIVLAAAGIPGPARAVEDRLPIVRRGAVGFGVRPDVPVGLFIVAARPAFVEPGVLVRGVGIDLVDDDFEAEAVGAFEQPVEIGQRSEDRVDPLIVGDVVAIILHRGSEEGRQPHCVDAQRGDMVEPLGDPGEVADPVAIGVEEGAGVDLIDDRAAPPGCGGRFRPGLVAR